MWGLISMNMNNFLAHKALFRFIFAVLLCCLGLACQSQEPVNGQSQEQESTPGGSNIEDLFPVGEMLGEVTQSSAQVFIQLGPAVTPEFRFKLGYDKLLAQGSVTIPMNITVKEASERAAEKIKAAGGKIKTAK